MLVLSRKEGQRIKIGDNIWITVIEFRGNKVRIGISAPQNVPISREELLKEKDEPEADVLRGLRL